MSGISYVCFIQQVLLKECENFTETVGPAPSDSVGRGVQSITVKYQDGGVDINQWISEEFHSYITPEVSIPRIQSNVHFPLNH